MLTSEIQKEVCKLANESETLQEIIWELSSTLSALSTACNEGDSVVDCAGALNLLHYVAVDAHKRTDRLDNMIHELRRELKSEGQANEQ